LPNPASRGSRFLLSHASSTLILRSRYHRSSALSLFFFHHHRTLSSS
ncbi:unnamed protein product, partial [Arabidopsis halleri]